jgi:hypothetical protein
VQQWIILDPNPQICHVTQGRTTPGEPAVTLFNDNDARADFFRKAEVGMMIVTPGSWIAHAKAAELGIWGNEDELIKDCARIAALELKAVYGGSVEPSAIAVASTSAFNTAFRQARGVDCTRILGAVRCLGLTDSHPLIIGLQAEAQCAGGPPANGEDVATAIAAELSAMDPLSPFHKH